MNPPWDLPWVLAGIGLIALIGVWLFWHDETGTVSEPSVADARTTGSASPIFQQTNSGGGDNIGIGHIENFHVAPPKLQITDDLVDEIAKRLNPMEPVGLIWRRKKRGEQLARELTAKLTSRGFVIGAGVGIGEITGVEFEHPITISPNGFEMNGISIMSGLQVIAIETDL